MNVRHFRLRRSPEIDILRDAAAIEAEWWDLWSRDPAATPFQSPAWLMPWRRHFDQGETQIVCVRDQDGRLCALLPFFTHEGRLLLWGSGTGDRLDGLFAPVLEMGSLAAAMAALDAPADLFQLSGRSPLRRMRLPAGWSARDGLSDPCAVLPLPAAASPNMESRLRYYRRRATRAGMGKPERGTAADFPALVELHRRRWAVRGEPGIFGDARMANWLGEASLRLEEAGMLRLHFLRREDATVAALLVLAANGRSYDYIGGFDPELSSFGLGTILIGHAIEEAQREGHSAFDFLRGREPYKYRWGARDEPTHARLLLPGKPA